MIREMNYFLFKNKTSQNKWLKNSVELPLFLFSIHDILLKIIF
jgi:hypothetical protein